MSVFCLYISICVVSSPCFLLEASKHTCCAHLLHSPLWFPLSVCPLSVAMLSFLVVAHLPLSVSQPHIFLSFRSSFLCPPWRLHWLFSFWQPLNQFSLSSVPSAFFPVLFKSTFPLYTWWKAQQFFFFTYSRLTVLLQQHSFGPYKEIIQRVQGALERCLAGDLLESLLLNLYCWDSFGQHMVHSKALRQHVCVECSLGPDVLWRTIV